MLREKLNKIIQEATQSLGYAYYSGFAYRMQQDIICFPAAWVNPLRMSRTEGRKEGHITYAVTLYLMRIDRRLTQEEKEKAWSEMELELLQLVDQILRSDAIFLVENLSAQPAERTLTQHGELSLKGEFEVKIAFCNDLIETPW